MSRAGLSIHDADAELYDALNVEELNTGNTFWKVLETPSASLTVFRPDPYDPPEPEPEPATDGPSEEQLGRMAEALAAGTADAILRGLEPMILKLAGAVASVSERLDDLDERVQALERDGF